MTELSIIGLMSGTSADGIDAAVLITDGVRVTRTASCGHFDYRQDTREAIRACCADPAMFLLMPLHAPTLIPPLLLITRLL